MKLYDSPMAPNPRRVRIFLAEKGLSIPTEVVDLACGAHHAPAFLRCNPRAEVPVLETDEGVFISETSAICRYIEALQPDPNLMGQTALEVAQVEMWQRRLEFGLFLPVAAVFRHLHPAMAKTEVPQVPEWAEANRPKVLAFLEFLDQRLAESAYIAGARFTYADIVAVTSIDFMKVTRTAVPEKLSHVVRWRAEVSARPSMAA